MRYDDQDRRSSNVEDRRSQGGRGFRFPGGLGLPGRGGRGVRIPVGGRGGFSLTTLLIIGAIMLFFGINPLEILTGGSGGAPRSGFDIPSCLNRPTSAAAAVPIFPGFPAAETVPPQAAATTK